MSKHTPGPWTINNHGAAIYAKVGSDNHRIASISAVSSLAEEEANAQLIAAAPDLLVALRDLMPVIEASFPAQQRVWLSEARAAIAKATGA